MNLHLEKDFLLHVLRFQYQDKLGKLAIALFPNGRIESYGTVVMVTGKFRSQEMASGKSR